MPKTRIKAKGDCEICQQKFDISQLFTTGSFIDTIRSTDEGIDRITWKVCNSCREKYTDKCDCCHTIYPSRSYFCGHGIYPEGNKERRFAIYDNILNRLNYIATDLLSGNREAIPFNPMRYLCDNCQSTPDYFSCSECCGSFEIHFEHEQLMAYCQECGDRRYLEESESADDDIHDYDTDPLRLLNFLGNPTDKIYYGVELELDCPKYSRSDCATLLSTVTHNFAIFKYDSSITGFETVSAPATLEIHRQKWLDFFDKLPGEMYDGSDCGMHVHVSRKPLSQLCIGKIVAFINNPDNKKPIVYIAGRESKSFAKLLPKKVTDCFVSGDRHSLARYEAVNLTNDETIEIRIFASTIYYETLMMRLEFVVAVVNFCQQTSIKHLYWADFLNWLIGRNKQFPHLTKFVVQHRKMISA